MANPLPVWAHDDIPQWSVNRTAAQARFALDFVPESAMSRLFALLALLFGAPLLAAAQPLVTPSELSARLGEPQLRVIDIRDGKNDDGKTPYEAGHIAGSLAAPYAKWRGPKDNPGKLPSEEALTALVRSLGIDDSTPVAIVYEGSNSTDFGSAARVYWTLKAAGVHQLSILNGGLKAWRAANLPLTTDVAAVAPSTFTVKIDPKLVATQDEVASAIGSEKVRLLDARPAAFFFGETRHAAAKSPGTIVGAKNVDQAVWFAKGSGALLPTSDVKRIAQESGVQTDQPTVSFCNTGHWAATNWFVLSEVLGQKDVKLYPESTVGWSNAGLPMANVPSRLAQFWLQLREATGNL
jgi:thiosulfate/3-mercaptopyruvate sulfurtransferase